jgi:hypothetical protein
MSQIGSPTGGPTPKPATTLRKTSSDGGSSKEESQEADSTLNSLEFLEPATRCYRLKSQMAWEPEPRLTTHLNWGSRTHECSTHPTRATTSYTTNAGLTKHDMGLCKRPRHHVSACSKPKSPGWTRTLVRKTRQAQDLHDVLALKRAVGTLHLTIHQGLVQFLTF